MQLEQAPKVNLESQGKESTDNDKTPKQHTPFCLGYRIGVLESGLSADVELRERKGGWLVRNCSLVVVSREFLQWLCTMESRSWDGAVGNGSHDKREGCRENGSNLRHTFDVENQRDDMGQLSPVSEI